MKTFTLIILFTYIKQEFAQETVTKVSVGSSIMDVDKSPEKTRQVTSSPVVDPEQNLVKTFWIYRPDRIVSPAVEDVDVYKVQFREPLLLTRLAKSFTFDYDPYFNKDYFEPFERRPKPVNVLTFRRNRIMPKENFQMTPDSQILDMAEIQSPFNSVGQFWRDNI